MARSRLSEEDAWYRNKRRTRCKRLTQVYREMAVKNCTSMLTNAAIIIFFTLGINDDPEGFGKK